MKRQRHRPNTLPKPRVQSWEFALSLFALLLFALLLFALLLFRSLLFCSLIKEQLEQNEWIALFTFSNTIVICFLRQSDSLFLRVGKLKTGPKNVYHTFWLCLKKNKESAESDSLIEKDRKNDSLFFVKKRAIRTKSKERIPNPASVSEISLYLFHC